MSYLVAVLPDRPQAEAAYATLLGQGIAAPNLQLVGPGHADLAQASVIDPNQQALNRSRLMAVWLIPFGFIGGIAFGLATDLHTFAWAGTVGDKIVGGILGAIGGAMGSVAMGGSTGTILGQGESQTYGQRLARGQYLLIMRGSALKLQQATKTLRGFNPDGIRTVSDDV